MAKRNHEGVIYYTSDLLDSAGIKHGFFTRLGGVSKPPFDSLNLKRDLGDSDANIDQNRILMCQRLGMDARRLVFAKLTHGGDSEMVEESHAGVDIEAVDALITKTLHLPICLSVADCLPIVVADPTKQIVAVIHGGWRSLVSSIIPSSIKNMTKLGAQPTDLIAAIGPGIAVESYEVGEELIIAMRQHVPEADQVLVERNGKTYCDLRILAELQLQKTGVSQIDHIDIDTFTHTNEFFSYRAEGTTGRFGVVASL